MEILIKKMKFFCNKLIHWLVVVLVLIFASGCSSSDSPEPQSEPQLEREPEVAQKVRSIPVQKKVLYSQRSNEGKNAINVIEEQSGNRRALRIIVQRGDLSSNLVHPIDSPNFVISIPPAITLLLDTSVNFSC